MGKDVDLDRDLGVIIARMVSDSGALDAAAEKIVAKAKTVAAPHVKTGHYMNSFGVEKVPGKKGVVDSVAFNDDPAAISIEFGHQRKDGSFEPGQFPLTIAKNL